jgi:hypothetical protein
MSDNPEKLNFLLGLEWPSKIKTAREASGLDLPCIASNIGVTPSAYYDLEETDDVYDNVSVEAIVSLWRLLKMNFIPLGSMPKVMHPMDMLLRLCHEGIRETASFNLSAFPINNQVNKRLNLLALAEICDLCSQPLLEVLQLLLEQE